MACFMRVSYWARSFFSGDFLLNKFIVLIERTEIHFLTVMYQNLLLQCSKDTRFKVAALDSPGVARRNPACGDEIELSVKRDDAGGLSVRYRAQACAVTLASASILAGAVEGLTPEAAGKRVREARAFFESDADWSGDWCPDEMRALGEVRAFPMRMACVRLPWEALEAGLGEIKFRRVQTNSRPEVREDR
jgi:nitrogen fixation NifU-like protein